MPGLNLGNLRCRAVIFLGWAILCLVGCAQIGGSQSLKMGPLDANVNIVLRRNSHIDYGVDPARSRYGVFVPSNYAGTQPFGLLVYISASDDVQSLPAGWADVLTARKLLLVAPQAAGNHTEQAKRMGLGVLGALAMMQLYKIDPARVYTAGISGGARTACDMAFYQSDLFKGTIQSCGVDFVRQLAQQYATSQTDTNGNHYGVIDVDPIDVANAKSRVRFALITGSNDFRHGNVLDLYNLGFNHDGYKAKLFDIPGMGHQDCNGQTLSDALDFVEKR